MIKNNLFLDIGNPQWGGGGRLFQFSNGPSDLTVEHNTGFQTTNIAYAAGAIPSPNFVFRDNIAPHNTYGVFGDASGIGTPTLEKYFPGYQYLANVMIANAHPNSYPPGNYNADGIPEVGFADLAAGDYSLTPASPYFQKATDGSDIGVNWPQLQAALSAPKQPQNLVIN